MAEISGAQWLSSAAQLGAGWRMQRQSAQRNQRINVW